MTGEDSIYGTKDRTGKVSNLSREQEDLAPPTEDGHDDHGDLLPATWTPGTMPLVELMWHGWVKDRQVQLNLDSEDEACRGPSQPQLLRAKALLAQALAEMSDLNSSE
jgi:hypothetical protein